MSRSYRMANPAPSISLEMNSHIEVGDQVCRRNHVQDMPSFSAVYAAEDNVASRDLADRTGIEYRVGNCRDPGVETDFCGSLLEHQNFRQTGTRVVLARVDDPIQIPWLDSIWVYQDEFSDPAPEELIKHDASCSRTTNYAHLQRSEQAERSATKGLCEPFSELRLVLGG